MSRRPPAKNASKPKAKPAKPQRVYIAVRALDGETTSYTEPDRVFASQVAARKYAEQLNRELRALTRPFEDDREPDSVMSGGEAALIVLLKKLGLSAPKSRPGDAYIDWAAWWDRAAPDMTSAQRDAIWDALDEFEWYKVKATTLEG